MVKAVALRQLQRDQKAAGESGAPQSGGDSDAERYPNPSDDPNVILRHNGLLGSDKRIVGDLQNGEEYQEKLSRMEGSSAASRDWGTPHLQRGRLASAGPDQGRMPDWGRSRRGARGDGATLAEFCRDLVAEARAGRLDPVSGYLRV